MEGTRRSWTESFFFNVATIYKLMLNSGVTGSSYIPPKSETQIPNPTDLYLIKKNSNPKKI